MPRGNLAVGFSAVGVLLLALSLGCAGAGVRPAVPAAPPSPASNATTPPPRAAAIVEQAPATPAPQAPVLPPGTPTPEPTPDPTPAPTPRPTPVPVPFAPIDALVVTATESRAGPSMAALAVRSLAAGSTVSLVAEERGQNWIIGDQDWVPLSHRWETTWYQLADGGYLHRAFVFLPDQAPLPGGSRAERYVIVDLDGQTAYAMVGTTIVREMPVTTGKPGFETPTGTHYVLAGGRILNERMTSQRAGFSDPNDLYDVERVLYTQYFAEGGFALHLNYWQPESVFGATETSHGCVGMLLADAQFLWLFAQAGTRVVVRHGGGPDPALSTPLPPPPPPPAPGAPAPEASPGVRIFAVQDGQPAGTAIVAARAVAGATCTLTYFNAAGLRRELAGMESRQADAGGWLEWKWIIEAGAPPGRGIVTVHCPGGSATADFVVR